MPGTTADRVRQVIDELFGVPATALANDVSLQDGLQLDSLSVVELQVAIEDTFDIHLDTADDSTSDITTFGQLVDAVTVQLNGKAQSA